MAQRWECPLPPAPTTTPAPTPTACQKQCKDNSGYLKQALKRHAQGTFPELKGLVREATEAEVLDADEKWRNQQGRSKMERAQKPKLNNKNPADGTFSTLK